MICPGSVKAIPGVHNTVGIRETSVLLVEEAELEGEGSGSIFETSSRLWLS